MFRRNKNKNNKDENNHNGENNHHRGNSCSNSNNNINRGGGHGYGGGSSWNKNSIKNHKITKRSRPKTAIYGSQAVGTEAAAQHHLEWNTTTFLYPDNGFINRIEYSLLYNMIHTNEIFPPEVIKEHISKEDFSTYLYARPLKGTVTKTLPVSYAQLTAILALAGDTWTPKSEIPDILCKAILKVVVEYAESNNLDRKDEIDELLQPLLFYSQQKDTEEAWAFVIPLYIGWTASLLTGNVVPLMVAYGVANVATGIKASQNVNSQKNIHTMKKVTQRASDVEHTSLLNEIETSENDDIGYLCGSEEEVGEWVNS